MSTSKKYEELVRQDEDEGWEEEEDDHEDYDPEDGDEDYDPDDGEEEKEEMPEEKVRDADAIFSVLLSISALPQYTARS